MRPRVDTRSRRLTDAAQRSISAASGNGEGAARAAPAVVVSSGKDGARPPLAPSCQRIADTFRAVTRRVQGDRASRLKYRVAPSTPCNTKAASTHCCDDEGKEDNQRDDRDKASRSLSGADAAVSLSRSTEALSLADEARSLPPASPPQAAERVPRLTRRLRVTVT